MTYLRINSVTEAKAVIFPLGEREKEMLSEALYNLFKDSPREVCDIVLAVKKVEKSTGGELDKPFVTCEDQNLGSGGEIKIGLFDGKETVAEATAPIEKVEDLEALLNGLLKEEKIQEILVKDLAFEIA